MIEEGQKTPPPGGNGAGVVDAANLASAPSDVQEILVNNRLLLAQYFEAATLAQERLLAYDRRHSLPRLWSNAVRWGPTCQRTRDSRADA